MAEAFAVYCETDQSLNFYKRDTVPTAGSVFEGKVATAVYTGIESDVYAAYGTPWYEQCYEVVETVSFVDEISPTSIAYWFMDFYELASFDATHLDTSNVTSMAGIFQYCSALESVSFRGCDLSSVETVLGAFASCSILQSVDLGTSITESLTNCANFFANCKLLQSVDLSNFKTDNVTNMNTVFMNCNALKTIYVSEMWSTASVTSSTNMFSNCHALVGGNGTAFNSANRTATYACIDTPETPGYFTYKKYVDRTIDYLIKAGTMLDIANAIRSKTGLTGSLKPSQMADAIKSIGAS